MKKFIFTCLALIVFAGTAFSQAEEEEAQLFGNSRSFVKMVKFGKLDKETVSQNIVLKNIKQEDMIILGFELPAGVSAMPDVRVVKPGESATVVVTVYPQIYSCDKNSEIKIKTGYMEEDLVVKVVPYKIVTE